MNQVNQLSRLSQLIAKYPDQIKYLRFNVEMPTTADAAKVLKTDESQIIKTCIVKVGKKDTFVAAILQGTDRIDWKKFEEISIEFKKHRFATHEEATEMAGYPAGGTPPIGLSDTIQQIWIDKKVFNHKEIYGGGGEKESLIQISPALMKELNNGTCVEIAKTDS